MSIRNGKTPLCSTRIATAMENQFNQRIHYNTKSGAKGVCWFKQTQQWQVRIMYARKSKHIGLFDTLEEAKIAYALASTKIHRSFGRTE